MEDGPARRAIAAPQGGEDVSTEIQKRQDGIADLLMRSRGQLAVALPKHLTADRMIRVTLTTLRRNPALQRCSVPSFLGAVFRAAQLGLEIDSGLGHAYLIPYREEATLVIGYQGLLDLVRRSGQVSTIYAREVYEGDVFSYSFGLEPKLEHVPGDACNPDGITHVYAVARLRDGGVQYEVMRRSEVEAIRKRSRAGASGPWVTDYAMMARKTVLRRLCKLLPLSIEAQRAVTLDEAPDAGIGQGLAEVWREVEEAKPETVEAEVVTE